MDMRPTTISRRHVAFALFVVLATAAAACQSEGASGADVGSECTASTDCASAVCADGVCQATTSNDALQDQPGPACGAALGTPCANGKGCSVGGDCASGICANAVCLSPSAADGAKNGTETDVDCGGADTGTPRCATGKACGAGTDCESVICDAAGKCQAPSATDAVKNGDESDVDCGGTTTGAPRCAVARGCKVHADCASDGCGYDGKCVVRRSCTGHMGGDTCGVGESNDPAAKHESCCTSVPFTSKGKTVNLDKYEITAGRMRAFVERTKGDLRGAMTGLAGFPQGWLGFLPKDETEVNARLGPYEVFEEAPRANGLRQVDGCYIGGQGTRTWWAPASAGDPTKMGREQLDEKALNCVGFYMLYALCAWDGGRLPTSAEVQAAWRGPDERPYPWGATLQDARMVHKFNYYYPQVNAAGQACQQGHCDNSIFIAAPGRRQSGYGAYGHADLAGLVFDMVYDGDYVGKWIGSGSWENHVPAAGGQAGDYRARPRYWATGGRCAR